MCHFAGENHPGNRVNLGQSKVAKNAVLSIGASVGLASVVVPQFHCFITKPSDVNGYRTEARDEAHKFIRALEQGG